MKIENVEVDKEEMMACLDLAYHELRYVYKKSPTSANDAIRGNMKPELRREYYRNKEFREHLKSVLRYAISHGKSIIKYAEEHKKLPPLNDQKVSTTDLEILLELNDRANLGKSAWEK